MPGLFAAIKNNIQTITLESYQTNIERKEERGAFKNIHFIDRTLCQTNRGPKDRKRPPYLRLEKASEKKEEASADQQGARLIDTENVHSPFIHYTILKDKKVSYSEQAGCDGSAFIEQHAIKSHGKFIYKRILSFERTKKLLCQILLGVDALHTKNIAHRDLKTQNMLFFIDLSDLRGQHDCIQLIDFGNAIKIKPKTGHCAEGFENFFGSPKYTAPEVMQCVTGAHLRVTDKLTDEYRYYCGFILELQPAGSRLFYNNIDTRLFPIKLTQHKINLLNELLNKAEKEKRNTNEHAIDAGQINELLEATGITHRWKIGVDPHYFSLDLRSADLYACGVVFSWLAKLTECNEEQYNLLTSMIKGLKNPNPNERLTLEDLGNHVLFELPDSTLASLERDLQDAKPSKHLTLEDTRDLIRFKMSSFNNVREKTDYLCIDSWEVGSNAVIKEGQSSSSIFLLLPRPIKEIWHDLENLDNMLCSLRDDYDAHTFKKTCININALRNSLKSKISKAHKNPELTPYHQEMRNLDRKLTSISATVIASTSDFSSTTILNKVKRAVMLYKKRNNLDSAIGRLFSRHLSGKMNADVLLTLITRINKTSFPSDQLKVEAMLKAIFFHDQHATGGRTATSFKTILFAQLCTIPGFELITALKTNLIDAYFEPPELRSFPRQQRS